MVTRITKNIQGVDYTLETGRLALQANASVLVQAGDTVVLCTVTVGPENPDLDFFPLSVDYVEKLYAAGMISSSRFIKREGRLSDREVLSARLLDRSIRSLFPEELIREVQVITQVLAYDKINDPEILQCIGASAGLLMTGLPFEGPVMIVRSGLVDGKVVYFPNNEVLEKSDMNLMVSVTDKAVVSIDAEGKLVSEDILEQVLNESIERGKEFLDLQRELVEKAGKKTIEFTLKHTPEELKSQMESEAGKFLDESIFIADKPSRNKAFNAKLKELHAKLDAEFKASDIAKYWDEMIKARVRKAALVDKKRIDGRELDELRPISAEIGVLPRVHGSAIFNRGETQVLSIVTLGSTKAEQTLEGIEGEDTKRYMHHYNFPGYSVGEIDRKLGMANRRAIGHGMIGEKSLLQVMPGEEEFKYTVRVVSEVLSSNGSTSMAATCGSTLALMDAGVKIKSPIGGISMGLVYDNEKNYVLYTDILGDEDHFGDMDFKITGSREGWTAIQLDNKLKGIPVEVLIKAVAQSKKTRLKILDVMESVIAAPREDMSKYAPRITTVNINPEKIGELIGPGGKVIKEIVAESGCEIDIEETGAVNIFAISKEEADKAIMLIKNALNEVEIGTILDATVKRVESYGVFIEINKNFGGLVHVSKIADQFIGDVSKVIEVGKSVKVRYEGQDDQGRYNFSMKGIDNGLVIPEEAPREPREPRDSRENNSNDGERSNDRSHHSSKPKQFIRKKYED